jgi:hypothetical protein
MCWEKSNAIPARLVGIRGVPSNWSKEWPAISQGCRRIRPGVAWQTLVLPCEARASITTVVHYVGTRSYLLEMGAIYINGGGKSRSLVHPSCAENEKEEP